MRLKIHWLAVPLILCVLVATGCASFPGLGKGGSSSSQSLDEAPEAVERRIEAHARYASAIIHDLNDRTAEAVDDYYRAAQLDAKNVSLTLKVTRRLLQLKENQKALDLLEKATDRPGAPASLFTRLAAVHALMGETNKAVAATRAAMKRDPESAVPYQQLAQILIQQGNYEQALKLLRDRSARERLQVDGLISIVELCLATLPAKPADRDLLRAIAVELLDRALEHDPTNPLLLQRMADSYLVLEKSEQASDLYLRLLERFPHLPGLRERLIEIYLRQQDLAKATSQLESIVRDNPTNLRAHYMLGTLAYEARDMEKAREHFEKVILLNPEFEQAYYDLAGVLINLDLPADAIETLEKARAKFKLRFLTELYSALAHSRLENYPQALKHFEAAEIIARATETNRLNHVFYFQIGAAYERNQQYGDAERYFRRCLELEPDFHEALNYLGYMWAERGENLHEALELIQQAVSLEPDNAAYLDSLGWVLYKLGRPREALGYVRRAIELSEEPDPVLLDHLGDIHFALEEPGKAREAWRRSLDLKADEAVEAKLRSLNQRPAP